MKTLVEVDGCYWHGCKEHYPDRWSDEQQNVEMQRDVRAEQAGWRVLRFWEHELFSDIEGIIDAMVA
jgi:DNA mismatch endonuclease (patch repair protein)